MFRRTFLSALGAVPLLGFLKPKKAKGDVCLVGSPDVTYAVRGSGRTQRALQRAIKALDEYPCVCLVVSSEVERERLVDVVKQMGRDGAARVSYFPNGDLYVNARMGTGLLYIRSIALLPPDANRELFESLKYAHEGPWPTEMVQ
jgi:hypothetical protein